MAWHFVTRMYNIAPWVLLRCIYSTDIMSKRSHGRIFLIDWHGIQRNCLRKQAMCMNKLQVILIEKFVIRRIKRRGVNISMERTLVGMKDVNWRICWMYPMHRSDFWDVGIIVEWYNIIH